MLYSIDRGAVKEYSLIILLILGIDLFVILCSGLITTLLIYLLTRYIIRVYCGACKYLRRVYNLMLVCLNAKLII